MSRLTVTISPERHKALKEAAARRGKTIGQIIEESLEAYGIKTESEVAAYIAQARARSRLSEKDALDLAVKETRAARK